MTYIFLILLGATNQRGTNVKQLTSKNRKQLKTKMAEALNDNISTLSASMQDILLDDLVTAFESRFEVLNRAQLNLYCFATIGVKVPPMRRFKLEMYVDILAVLAHKGPLKLTHVMYKANVNCNVLKEYLDFLIKQGLVEERTVRKQRLVYAVTQRGITVLKYFKELKQVLPIVEEARNQEAIPY